MVMETRVGDNKEGDGEGNGKVWAMAMAMRVADVQQQRGQLHLQWR